MRIFLSLVGVWSLLISAPLASETCELLAAKLQGELQQDQDPYAEEYKNTWPLMRYPVLKEQNGSCYAIDNFRNGVYEDSEGQEKGQWGPVVIDTSKVLRASLMITVFYIQAGPIRYQAGHGQMHFEFESGGVQVPEGELSGLIHSFEAIREADVPYNAIGGGLRDAYDSVMVLSSPSDSYKRASLRDHAIDVYELDLTAEQVRELLKNSLQEALDRPTLAARPYHTTRNSCVSNQVRLLNTVLDSNRRIKEWHSIFGIKLFRTLSSIAPRKLGRALQKNNLVRSHLHLNCPDEGLEYVESQFGHEPQMNRKAALFKALYD